MDQCRQADAGVHKACHQRHIRVIFDGVFNHMGIRSFAFQDVLKNQQNSPYKDWFTIYSWDTDTSAFSYQGWFSVPDLPEIREDEQGIVNGPKSYIYNCTSRWMMPNGNVANGIDGWRLDVAFCVDHAFWKDWRMLVKSHQPRCISHSRSSGQDRSGQSLSGGGMNLMRS